MKQNTKDTLSAIGALGLFAGMVALSVIGEQENLRRNPRGFYQVSYPDANLLTRCTKLREFPYNISAEDLTEELQAFKREAPHTRRSTVELKPNDIVYAYRTKTIYLVTA